MRILMPSIVDPSAQQGGAWTATRGLLSMLKAEPVGAEVDVLAAKEITRIRHSVRKWGSGVEALFSDQPAKVLFHRHGAVLREFRRLTTAGEYDFVVLNGSDMLWLAPHVPSGTPVVVVAHNVEHQLQAAYVEGLLKPLHPLFAWDCERLRRYEIAGLRRAGHALFLSSEDEASMRSECPDLVSMTVPPVFHGAPGRVRSDRSEASTIHVGMMANFDWWPNREGVDWFLRDVLPSLQNAIVVHLFGIGSSDVAAGRERVVGHGYVESPAEAWAVCDFMICPILSGGGVCIKVAEAIYNGTPVLATPFATRGLPLPPSESIALREGAADWIRFLNGEARAFALQAVPAEISARFGMDVHARRLADFLVEIARRETPAESFAHVPSRPLGA